jgi:hypothetical protein
MDCYEIGLVVLIDGDHITQKYETALLVIGRTFVVTKSQLAFLELLNGEPTPIRAARYDGTPSFE